MATISKIVIKNIRSHTNTEVVFSPDVTIITGENGSGKTSILEAIYSVLRGTSFKGTDTELLNNNQPWWRIDADFNTKQKRRVKFNPENQSKRKQFEIDSKITARLPQKEKYPVILFEPDDLRLLHGSPNRRRHFIDTIINQLHPPYGTVLRKYERILKQRNNLLKNPHSTTDQLFAWNIPLAEFGAYIINQRIAFIEQVNSSINQKYHEIAHNSDQIAVHYSHTVIGNTTQKLLSELQQKTERDKITGSTSVGPHRHDIIFTINNQPAQKTASRGEARTIVLALKFIEVALTEKITGQKPIILLDDVFSELDTSRQHSLSENIKGYQIIMTSTHTTPTITKETNFKEVNLTPSKKTKKAKN